MTFEKRELVKTFGLYSFLTYLVFCITALIILHEQYYKQCWVIILCFIIIFLYPILVVGFILVNLFFLEETGENLFDKNERNPPPLLPEENKCSVKLEVNEEFRRGVNTPSESDGVAGR
jgi:hypothetical protein